MQTAIEIFIESTNETSSAWGHDSNRPPSTCSEPTFFVLGCQRCGTTWIDKALRDHPEVYLPPQKQTYFFDQYEASGLESYLANFQDVPDGRKAIGEVATGYSLPRAFEALADAFGHARLVMTLRDPVEQVLTSYLRQRSALAKTR